MSGLLTLSALCSDNEILETIGSLTHTSWEVRDSDRGFPTEASRLRADTGGNIERSLDRLTHLSLGDVCFFSNVPQAHSRTSTNMN
jgi:hypothetical protein